MSETDGSKVPVPPAPGLTSSAARFFVVPAIIVGVCVFCLLVAGGLYVLLKEKQEPTAYLEQVIAGGGNRRWQAAYELSKVIAASDGEVDDTTSAMIVEQFRKAGQDDPRVRRYLALALGRIRRPSSVEALRGALTDADTETRIYVLWGLGFQRDRPSAGAIAAALGDEDAGVRKMAAYSLGFLGDPETSPALRAALRDRVPDVRWNAAVALAQMQDGAGFDELIRMLDRESLEGMTDEQGNPVMDGERIRQAMITAIRGLVILGDPRAAATVSRLADSEPDLRVRSEAMKALQETGW